MMTVSAVARLIPKPPALVDSRKTKDLEFRSEAEEKMCNSFQVEGKAKRGSGGKRVWVVVGGGGMTVSAVARLIPKPPAFVDRWKTKDLTLRSVVKEWCMNKRMVYEQKDGV